MCFGNFSFGSLRIDGRPYEHDVVIVRGEIRDRKKKPSKKFRAAFGPTAIHCGRHTLEVPPTHHRYRCIRQITGDERSRVRGKRHKVKLLILPTIKAIEVLQEDPADTNAIIHVTC